MSIETRTQRRYDHRLKELVRSTGSIGIALESGVPRSTAYGWLRRSHIKVVSLDVHDTEMTALQREVIRLRRQNTSLVALLRLIMTVIKVAGFSLSGVSIPEEQNKRRVLRAIDQAHVYFPLRTVLRLAGLTHGRYGGWTADPCGQDDIPSCPKTSPQRLTAAKVSTIHEMVTSDDFRHIPTGTLARLAERLGRAFASASIWYRLVQLHRWRRPRHRVHPAKPNVGVRASKPNETWHIDTTLLRLIDGRRVYLHAVIDNFSRRILAWCVLDHFQPAVTSKLLLDASQTVSMEKSTVIVDGGVENYHTAVDQPCKSDVLKRVLAQTDIRSSNSMIESWWRALKRQWLATGQIIHTLTITLWATHQ